MDKFVKTLASQNPKIELQCSNPNCNKKSKVKTVDFFSGKTYDFTCPYCKEITPFIDIKTRLDKFKKDAQKMGIFW